MPGYKPNIFNPVTFSFIYIFVFKLAGHSGYVHLDIVDPEAGLGTGQDGEPIIEQSSDKLEFMNHSVELKTEPEDYSKIDKVKYSKMKHTAGKDDNKRTENSSAQDGQVQDDIGE